MAATIEDGMAIGTSIRKRVILAAVILGVAAMAVGAYQYYDSYNYVGVYRVDSLSEIPGCPVLLKAVHPASPVRVYEASTFTFSSVTFLCKITSDSWEAFCRDLNIHPEVGHPFVQFEEAYSRARLEPKGFRSHFDGDWEWWQGRPWPSDHFGVVYSRKRQEMQGTIQMSR